MPFVALQSLAILVPCNHLVVPRTFIAWTKFCMATAWWAIASNLERTRSAKKQHWMSWISVSRLLDGANFEQSVNWTVVRTLYWSMRLGLRSSVPRPTVTIDAGTDKVLFEYSPIAGRRFWKLLDLSEAISFKLWNITSSVPCQMKQLLLAPLKHCSNTYNNEKSQKVVWKSAFHGWVSSP